ncbi:MAG: cyanophycinase, partial [Antricoccus sp.]
MDDRTIVAADDAPTFGYLMPVGGAEDRLGKLHVLSRFAALAGGAEARIIVIHAASSFGAEVAEAYTRAFSRLGVPPIIAMGPQSRADADNAELAEQLDNATGVFMSGGNQLILATALAGTAIGEAIHRAHRRGAIVGGTSAGASALSEHMISLGKNGATPKMRATQLTAGLGLVPNVIIDQHFSQRNRIGRLLSTVAVSPSQLGMGIDEDTAVLIAPDGTFEVIGRGVV